MKVGNLFANSIPTHIAKSSRDWIRPDFGICVPESRLDHLHLRWIYSVATKAGPGSPWSNWELKALLDGETTTMILGFELTTQTQHPNPLKRKFCTSPATHGLVWDAPIRSTKAWVRGEDLHGQSTASSYEEGHGLALGGGSFCMTHWLPPHLTMYPLAKVCHPPPGPVSPTWFPGRGCSCSWCQYLRLG